MAKKKYVGLATLTRLVENIKTNFASKSHTHTKSEITDFPTIPTKTSELKNDSGFKTTDNNTTYDLAASVNSANGDVKLNLTAGGTGSGTDAVSIVGTGSTKVTTNVSGVVSINNPVDSALSSTSTNPVQNKVVKTAIDGKVNNTVTVNGQALTKNVTLKASDVGADTSGTASSAVSSHNTSSTSHSDIRQLITGLTDRLNALADSDDTTLDQMSEIVAYIKNNKTLIEGITTNKVSVSDIVDNLTTNSSNKPLSAAQGMVIKGLIDALQLVVDGKATSAQGNKADTAVQSVKIGTTEYKKGTNVTLPAYPTTLPASDVSAWAKAKTKPSYTASEVGAATANHTHTTVNGHTVETNVPSNAVFTDTTYTSKSAASGGTDVSLVTTGEKYDWNVAKTHASATHAPSNAEKNVIVGVKQNGINLAVSSDRKVDISVPTLDTSDTTGTFSVPDYSSRVVSCENQLKNVDSSLLQVTTNLSQLNNDMDTAQNDIGTISTDVSDAKAKVNLYEEKVLALQSQVVSLQNENTELKNTVTELNSKASEIIENQDDFQVYTLLGGKVKVISGSVIRTGVGKDYIALFNAEQLKDYFGVTVNTIRLSISTYNGDDASQAVQFYSPENWQGSIYQYFSKVVSGSIRINYRMVYVYE